MMTDNLSQMPSILIVDDEPVLTRNQFSLFAEDENIEFRALGRVIHPQELEVRQLHDTNLILVDYRLQDWSDRTFHPSIAMKPATGLSLATVLRDHIDQYSRGTVTGIALFTALLDDIRGERLASKTARHVLAQMHNLEWIFEKPSTSRAVDSGRTQFKTMVILANAIQKLPGHWPTNTRDSMETVRRLLSMDKDQESFNRCWSDVRKCHLPIHEHKANGHGLQFIRWLLHAILPYPTFLWDQHWVAARLEITVNALKAVLADKDNPLAQDLGGLCYKGILSGFLGERWWHGAVDNYAWSLLQSGSGRRKGLHDALCERAGFQLCQSVSNPVVCLDAELEPEVDFSSPSAAVRIRPDHWPAFADYAWMKTKTLREDSSLVAMVDPDYRIPADSKSNE